MEIKKHINDTNASYRSLGAGNAKNTDLFLDQEHFEMFKDEGDTIKMRFDKKNLEQALLFIASILPRKFDCSSVHKEVFFDRTFLQDQLSLLDAVFQSEGKPTQKKIQQWNIRKNVVTNSGKIDDRFYFNGLIENVKYKDSEGNISDGKFTIRNYLAGGFSDISISKVENGLYDIKISNTVVKPYDDKKETGLEVCISDKEGFTQRIYFGTPGSGKSYAVKHDITKEVDNEGNEVERNNVFRTTFHPDSDYSTFVGCYKPVMKNKSKSHVANDDDLKTALLDLVKSGDKYPYHKFAAQHYEELSKMSHSERKQLLKDAGCSENYGVEFTKVLTLCDEGYLATETGEITYDFVPQVFTKAYIHAYNNPEEDTFLVIEEINRGNCAQIFGDLFQLLDRNEEGVSEYPIIADDDLRIYLEENLSNKEGIANGKLRLPANLNIVATMNTSDQSLFPMDSAFKRRWQWKYVPIDYSDRVKSYDFEIILEDASYSWVEFLKVVNGKILNTTKSEDKQMGNFFIKSDVKKEEFVDKVMSYLWFEVCKDFHDTPLSFFNYKDDDDREDTVYFSYSELYGDNGGEILKKFMQTLELKSWTLPQKQELEPEDNL